MFRQIKSDLLQARKSGEEEVKKLLTLLVGEIETRSKQAAYKGKSLDDIAASTIKSFVKEAKENIRTATGSAVESAKKEITILNKYLPTQLSDEEIQKVIDTLAPKNISQAMKHFAQNYKGKVDNSKVKKLVDAYLAKLRK